MLCTLCTFLYVFVYVFCTFCTFLFVICTFFIRILYVFYVRLWGFIHSIIYSFCRSFIHWFRFADNCFSGNYITTIGVDFKIRKKTTFKNLNLIIGIKQGCVSGRISSGSASGSDLRIRLSTITLSGSDPRIKKLGFRSDPRLTTRILPIFDLIIFNSYFFF